MKKIIPLCLLLLTTTLAIKSQPVSGIARERDSTIRINQYRFDPRRGLPNLDDRLTLKLPAGDSLYELVQFKMPLNRQLMETLKTKFNLKLNRYFPNLTYLEALTSGQLERLRQHPAFRAHVPYQPAFKIDPQLGKRTFRSPQRQALTGRLLLITLFPGSKAEVIATAIRKIGVNQVTILTQTPRSPAPRIRVEVPQRETIYRIAQIPAVEWIEEESEITLDNGAESAIIQSGAAGATPLYDRNLHGEGQIVGLIDAPLDVNHCFFADAAHPIGPQHRKVVGYRQANAFTFTTAADCEIGHGTHTAGTIAGQSGTNADNGIAFNARLTFGDLGDISGFAGGGGTHSFLNYLNAAKADGAFVHSNSWSDKGTQAYTVLSQDLDTYTWANEEDLVVISSSNNIDTNGNLFEDAPSPVHPPWTSKNGLSVGASRANNLNTIATGGVGPTADGRRKPDLYVPGDITNSAQAGTVCGLMMCGGSSMATPAVAGAAALVRQYYQEGWYPSGLKQPTNGFTPTGALLKATLLNGTRDITGSDAFGQAGPVTGYPTNLEGWGRLVLDDALYFSGDLRNLWAWDIRHSEGLLTGESRNFSVRVVSGAQPLKITLAWMEPPPAAASFANPVINDLDLVVIAPDGTRYQGNDFTASQSTANGVAVDNVNNVEMVLVNTPQVGEYTIQINGTTVNQGNPGQGFAVVATADTQNPPKPFGTQNTLVVRVGLSDLVSGALPNESMVHNIIMDVSHYVDEASYGTTTLTPTYQQIALLDHPKSYYVHPSRNMLIEMTTEIIAKLVTANPNVFSQGTANPADDIDRMVVFINDADFTGNWATTGPWPYELPTGLESRISVSINSVFNDPNRRVAQSMCHQLGMWDLFNHPNVVFAQPHVDQWDVMGNVARPQPMAWSKQRALWMTSHNPNAIRFIPRPNNGTTVSQTVPLNALSSLNADNPKAIAIGLTPGVTTLQNERVFYFLEARSNTTVGNADAVLPGSGVLLYYVNENIPQGEGPVRILDDNVATLSLSDAALEVGDTQGPAGTGLTISSVSPVGAEAARIQINFTPPVTVNDVNIVRGNPYWTSPDIWVDSQKDGFDEDNGRVPQNRGDQPVIGEVNRVYFRIHNPAGSGDAFDLTAFVRVSEPHQTLGPGGGEDFNRFVGQVFIPQIQPGESLVRYVEWTPTDDGDPHSCLHVEIPNVFNDANTYNNDAQQNVNEVRSSHASPFEPVLYSFSLTNPYDYYQLFYFRADNVPEGWSATFSQRSVLLAAHERIDATLAIHPPDHAPVCTEHQISVTSWAPRGITMVPVGGGTVQVNLRNRTDLAINTQVLPCQNKSPNEFAKANGNIALVALRRPASQPCAAIQTQGCTNPVRANEEIIVRYQDPYGNPVYHLVMTDANGCYSDTYTVVEGGGWRVSAEYPGSDCSGSGSTGTKMVAVPLPQSGDQDHDGLPSDQEPQGDHDHDGLQGFEDPDSDNDGILDGDEQLTCITNPDCNGNGTLDGKEAGRKIGLEMRVGAAFPGGGEKGLTASPNVHVAVGVTYRLTSQLGLKLWGGFSQFTGDALPQHPRWLNFSLNGVYQLNVWRQVIPYLEGGVGGYWNRDGHAFGGVNVGVGGRLPLKHSPHHLLFGGNAHFLPNNRNQGRFFNLSIGVEF